MKTIRLLIALVIAMPMFAQAKVVTCRGQNRGSANVKLMAKGDMKEEQAYGQYFAVGNFTFKITEPGQPAWEFTIPLAIPTYPNTGNVNIANSEGGSVYEEGGNHQINLSDFLSWGNYVRYNGYILDIKCSGIKF